jgi:predicted Zn-dependent protease
VNQSQTEHADSPWAIVAIVVVGVFVVGAAWAFVVTPRLDDDHGDDEDATVTSNPEREAGPSAAPQKNTYLSCTGNSFRECQQPTTELSQAYSDPSTCDGSGIRVCLVPMGAVSKSLVEHLVAYYGERYDIQVHVLPPVSFEAADGRERPNQVESLKLFELLADTQGRNLYRDPNAVLIGLVPVDMYTSNRPEWRWYFGGTSTSGGRTADLAVISTFRMDPRSWGLRADQELFHTRVRKLMNKYVAVLYYDLPLTDDPRSVTFRLIGGLDVLDRINERIPVPAGR